MTGKGNKGMVIVVALRLLFCGVILLAIAVRAIAAPGFGEQGVFRGVAPAEVVFQTGFELGDKMPELTDHEVVTTKARNGKQTIYAKIDKPNTAAFLKVPFEKMKGKRLELSFWISSPERSRCAVWATVDGGQKKLVTSSNKLTGAWSKITAEVWPATDKPGFFQIVAPSSYSAPAGRSWIDDLTLAVSQNPSTFTLGHNEHFPAVATDGKGVLWLAVTARPIPEKQVRIYRIEGSKRVLQSIIEPEGVSGIGTPQLVAMPEGCMFVVPVEQKEQWRIAYGKVTSTSPQNVAFRTLGTDATSNIAPAIAADGNGACVVWESNADGARGIYAAFITPDASSTPQRISALGVTSRNPDIVMLPGRRFFAAWDSLRKKSIDLYGAMFRDGKWEKESRLTSHPRIEKHVSLAAHGTDIWMVWQAQSFPRNEHNSLREQRIAMAKLESGKLLEPLGLEQVTPKSRMLVRPEIAFDPSGRLWLTIRESMGAQRGWRPVAWCYAGSEWDGPHILWPNQGRWAPATMTFVGNEVIAACQHDNIPHYWGIDAGKAPDWHSEVMLLPVTSTLKPASFATQPLVMGETKFVLADHLDGFSVSLAPQSVEHNGHRLNLYWGDMHNHSDISVCIRDANPPIVDLYAFQEDIARLDFTAITDHGYNLDHPLWTYSAEQVRAFHHADRFVTFLAEEWTSDHIQYKPRRAYRKYGHRNLIYLEPDRPEFFDSKDGDITPRMVWDALVDTEYITIPHQLADSRGNGPTDWRYADEDLQPLAEIFQFRGSYEYLGAPRQAVRSSQHRGHFMQDAWDLGLVIGVSASPDHGGGLGKTGVWCPELTRETLFQAFHARHTFGTSGAKMAVFVASGKHMMGDKVLRAGKDPIPFTIRGVSDKPITRIVIFRNNEIVLDHEHSGVEFDLTWTDKSPLDKDQVWYYVRLHREDKELAWSSPIWFFSTQAALEATIDNAHRLPELYPEGVPISKKLKPN